MARSLGSAPKKTDNGAGAIDSQALWDAVNRAVEIMTDQKALADELKMVCTEADEAGIASKAEVRTLARERFRFRDKMEILEEKLRRMAALRDALGPLGDTPLGEAAVAAAAPKRRGRKPKAQILPIAAAMKAAQRHLSGEDDPEQRMEEDLDRIGGDPAGAA